MRTFTQGIDLVPALQEVRTDGWPGGQGLCRMGVGAVDWGDRGHGSVLAEPWFIWHQLMVR